MLHCQCAALRAQRVVPTHSLTRTRTRCVPSASVECTACCVARVAYVGNQTAAATEAAAAAAASRSRRPSPNASVICAAAKLQRNATLSSRGEAPSGMERGEREREERSGAELRLRKEEGADSRAQIRRIIKRARRARRRVASRRISPISLLVSSTSLCVVLLCCVVTVVHDSAYIAPRLALYYCTLVHNCW